MSDHIDCVQSTLSDEIGYGPITPTGAVMTQEAQTNGGSALRFADRCYMEAGNTEKLAVEFAKGFLRK